MNPPWPIAARWADSGEMVYDVPRVPASAGALLVDAQGRLQPELQAWLDDPRTAFGQRVELAAEGCVFDAGG